MMKPIKENGKPIASIQIDIYENRDDIEVDATSDTMIHGIAALMISYQSVTKSTFKESLADLLLELNRIDEDLDVVINSNNLKVEED
ncbi:MAG: hypothetical protein WBI17_07165 [Clostridiaceae bacterium]